MLPTGTGDYESNMFGPFLLLPACSLSRDPSHMCTCCCKVLGHRELEQNGAQFQVFYFSSGKEPITVHHGVAEFPSRMSNFPWHSRGLILVPEHSFIFEVWEP